MKYLPVRVLLLTALVFVLSFNTAKGEDMVVEDGKTVSLKYTLKVDGEVVDTSEGKSPFKYVHGTDSILPGLSKGLAGMQEGQEKIIEILPVDGYGPLEKELLREVPKTTMPKDVEVDMLLETTSPDGRKLFVRVSEIKEETVIMDFNHPLAGKTLIFDVKVTTIN